ncbi:MAG: autotransporter-associated beta strand repeat-containing protein [Bacteroidales bacterium]|nr:autotransporter-associated beta strand repeat-containing protein [Bacteroidales bacterium]
MHLWKFITRCLIVFGLLQLSYGSFAQRNIEKLDRGLIAVKVPGGVFVSWRILGNEWPDVQYNLYRNSEKLNSYPLKNLSNYFDSTGTISSNYHVTVIKDSTESSPSKTVTVFENSHLDVYVRDIQGPYELNDASVGDLNGDGEYEIVIKRLSNDTSLEPAYTSLIEAYHLDGTFMWAIDLGPNRFNPKPINFAVYDFNNDGYAEVVLKSAEGTTDGLGGKIGDINNDGITNYRFSIAGNDITQGPEFLSVYDGKTGKEITRTGYIAREPIEQWGEPGMTLTQYAHRSGSCMITPAYLDGKNASIVIARGIYHRIKLSAYNFCNDSLIKIWDFDSNNWPVEYKGQGNHNLSVADVDNDGKDEIIYGSMTIDDDGTGLYSTGLGHGDALHVSDMDPDRKGLEIWQAQETSTGATYRDAGTGEILYRYKASSDQGRACAGDISANHRGFEMWGSTGCPLYSCQDGVIGLSPYQMNFMIWWDGDLLREMLDHKWLGDEIGTGTGTITKYNGTREGFNLLTANGTYSTNYTKGNPCIQADIFGDWREEVIWRSTDNKFLRIYFSTIPTQHGLYTLMHDPQYRIAVAWQNNAYNQPPHTGFYLGDGMEPAPPPPVNLGKKIWKEGTYWDTGISNNWVQNDSVTSFINGDDVLFDLSGSNSFPVLLADTLLPASVTVYAPNSYTFDGEGSLSGTMTLVKAGAGELHLNNNNYFSGSTSVWDGTLFVNGLLSQSHVYVKKFAMTAGKGTYGKGLTLEKGSGLMIGDSAGITDTLRIIQHLNICDNSTLYFDLSDDSSGLNKLNDVLIVNGDINLSGICKIHINKTNSTLDTGSYALIKFNGNFIGNTDNIQVEGIPGIPYNLFVNNNAVVLEIIPVRKPAKIFWTGGPLNNWDLANNKIWLNNGIQDWFVGYDTVVFSDEGYPNTEVTLIGDLPVSEIAVNSSKDYIFKGTGFISGPGDMVKTGEGRLEIINNNRYTGATIINQGVIEISGLNKSYLSGPLGSSAPHSENLVLNGGILEINGNPCTTNRGMTVGTGGGTLQVGGYSNNVEIMGTITGNGTLTKTGTGTLTLTSANDYTGGTMIREGSIYLGNDLANLHGLGSESLTIENGTLKMYDNTSYTDNCNWDIIVPENKWANIYLDSRASLTGTLTGKGTLYLFSPWIRSELRGNWSAFSGIINVTTDSDGGTFLIDNTAGYENCSVHLGDNVTTLYRRTSNITINIGELTGTSSSRLGAGGEGSSLITWKIGAGNTDAVFNGIICNDQFKNSGAVSSIIKTGTGNWVLTNSNIYNGPTIVESGELTVNNLNGSGTGFGTVTVKKNATLTGNGFISGPVNIEDGGILSPGNKGIGTLTINNNLTLLPGSFLSIDLDPSNRINDMVDIKGTLKIDGVLYLNNISTASLTVGDTMHFLNAVTYTGYFKTIFPAVPGKDLVWDTTLLHKKGTIIVSGINTIPEPDNSKFFMVFPNPVKNILTVKFDETLSGGMIEIQNLCGCTFFNSQICSAPELRIDISTIPPGIYFVKAVTRENITVKRFVKL